MVTAMTGAARRSVEGGHVCDGVRPPVGVEMVGYAYLTGRILRCVAPTAGGQVAAARGAVTRRQGGARSRPCDADTRVEQARVVRWAAAYGRTVPARLIITVWLVRFVGWGAVN